MTNQKTIVFYGVGVKPGGKGIIEPFSDCLFSFFLTTELAWFVSLFLEFYFRNERRRFSLSVWRASAGIFERLLQIVF